MMLVRKHMGHKNVLLKPDGPIIIIDGCINAFIIYIQSQEVHC